MTTVITRHRLVTYFLLAVFWITATDRFLLQELTRSDAESVETAIRVLCQLSLLGVGTLLLRKRMDLILMLIFCFFTLAGTCVVNQHSLFTWLDGLRNYVGYLFVIPIIRYLWDSDVERPFFVHAMERSLFLFLWLQLPCILIQYAQYSNLDYVGGSLGWKMSGVISNLIYLTSFYLMLRRWNCSLSYLENLKVNWILILLLFPTMLNETKVSFVYLAMYFIFLVPIDRNFVKRMIWIGPLVAIMLGLAVFAYSKVVSNSGIMMADNAIELYLIGDDQAMMLVEYILERDDEDVMETDFARGLKFFITPAVMNRQPSSWIWGYGLGQYKVGDSAKKSKFATRYYWLLRGTTIQSQYTWLETGLVGLGMYTLYWFLILRVGRRKGISRNKQLQWMLGLMALIFSVYNAPFLVVPFCIIFLFMAFVSSRWDKLPPYKVIKLLGSRPIVFSLREPDAVNTIKPVSDATDEQYS